MDKILFSETVYPVALPEGANVDTIYESYTAYYNGYGSIDPNDCELFEFTHERLLEI